MYRREYRISLLVGLAFFAAVFPYGGLGDVTPVYALFCVAMNGVSAFLFALLLYKRLTKRLTRENYPTYAWFLVLSSFCHLVFTFLNPRAWICIGISGAILIAMLADWFRHRNDPEE